MRRSSLGVLTYHRVTDATDVPPGLRSATPAAFERQVAMLARRFRPVSLADVLAARRGEADLPPRAVLVTFDDAYLDFAEHAWPILRRHGVPAALFVPTGFPDRPDRVFWWDRLYRAAGNLDEYRALRDRLKSLPHDRALGELETLLAGHDPGPSLVLGWDALRALAAEGVELAPHSRTHPLLNRLPPDELEAETAGALADLERETGVAAPAFAYPAGGWSEEAAAALDRAGYELAFCSDAGVNDLANADRLRLARLGVVRRTPTPVLRVQLARRPLRRPPPPVSRRATPPRVAYVMSRFPKLTETFILFELLALERRGVRVDLYPLMRARSPLMHDEAKPLVARARYLPFVSPGVLATQARLLVTRPRAYAGALAAVARGTWGSTRFLLGGLAVFPKVAHAAMLMEAEGVTHVHCHFASHPALAGFVIGRLTGIPYSFVAHGSDLHRDRHMLREKVAEAQFVLTVSDFNRRVILDTCGGGFGEKVHVLFPAVDTTVFHPNGRVPARRLAIGAVGTLHEVKGQAYLVEACRRLAEAGVDFECRIVGEGPDRDGLAAAIARAGLEGRVVLEGARTRDGVARLVRELDVLAVPSVPTSDGRREGLPTVILEAMASGVAVVASDLSGIPEAVEHEVTGLLVAPGDAEALARALARLRDDELRARLARAGRERALARYDLAAGAADLARRFGAGTGS